jgi:hypothetical protein
VQRCLNCDYDRCHIIERATPAIAEFTTVAKTAEPINKSQAVRDYLTKHPGATAKEIISALAANGIEVSKDLANQVKHRSQDKKKGRKMAKTAARQTATSNEADVNKSEEIRKAFKEMGRRTRPKDVIAALAEKGVTVSSSQVSMVRASMKKKSAKARRLAAASSEAPPAAASSPARAISANGLSADDLIVAKRLADQLGGLERMKAVLAVLDQLK